MPSPPPGQDPTTYSISSATSPMEYTNAPNDAPEWGEYGYDYGDGESRARIEAERGGPLDIDSDGENNRSDLDGCTESELDGSGSDSWDDVDRDRVDDT